MNAAAQPLPQSNTLGQFRITPETRAAIWQGLEAFAMAVQDAETRAGYLAAFRARFEADWPLYGATGGTVYVQLRGDGTPPPLAATSMRPADEGDYAWPDDDATSAARLMAGILRIEAIEEAMAELREERKFAQDMLKLAGFDIKAMRRVIAARKADPDARQAIEASEALYRQIAGVDGPMTLAMLPPPLDARPKGKALPAGARKAAKVAALLDMRRDR